MVATVAWKGRSTRVTNADSTTGWTALKISGTGGGPTAAAADGSLEGTGAVTCTVNKQLVALYYDIGSGNELDFTGGGGEEGMYVYVWINFLAAALLNNRSAGGLGIFLESSTPGTAQYHLWYFEGADTYAGGWKRLVLDPTETVSASAGTAISLSAVRYFGVFADVGGTTARFDNLICDAIDVGTGIRVYGTSTTDDLMGDILADEATNRWGIVTSLNDSDSALQLLGELDLGDDVGTNAATFTDVDKKIFVGEPTYYDGTSVTTSVPLTAFSVNCVGNATGATSITVGKAVGSDAGRNGWSIVGNASYDVSVDWDDGNVNTNLWYGCSFEALSGTLSWGTNTAHKLFSASFSGCEQFDPVGGVQLRNITFSNLYDDGTADASNNAALLWNASIDIQKSNFLANSHSSSDVAHGIEHTTVPSVATGTCTTANALGTTLIDSAASFTSTVAVNDYVYNETDGSYGQVTSITSNTELVMTALSGGTEDDWDVSDAYSISPAISYTDLLFSGNEKDILNSATGNDALFISKAGTSNPATATNTVVTIGSVTISIKVIDSSGTVIQGAQVSMYLQSDNSEVMLSDTNASGIASTTYTGATPANVYYRVRKASPGDTKYVNDSAVGTIESGTGLSATRTLRVDPNNNA